MEDQVPTVLKKLLVHVKAFILRGPTAYLPIEDWEGGDRNSFLKAFPLFKLKMINKEQREGAGGFQAKPWGSFLYPLFIKEF